MKKASISIFAVYTLLLTSGCAGIRYLTVETREPARITLPSGIKSILVVDNTVQQPSDIGHNVKKPGKDYADRTRASSDSVSIFYTEALAQFLGEEEHFDEVKYYSERLRNDNDFWQEKPIRPETMTELREATRTDAIVSLDKLVMQTHQTDFFRQENNSYARMNAKVNSVIRVYLPSMEGKIPAIHFTDSMSWEGYDASGHPYYFNETIPTPEDAMKKLAVYSAEKMSEALAPHWENQTRWYYTHINSKMREAALYAQNNQWPAALERWKEYYDKEKNNLNRAKAAHNIALSYEMLDDMENAFQWATTAAGLFEEATRKESLERKRARLYRKEIERRKDTSGNIDMRK